MISWVCPGNGVDNAVIALVIAENQGIHCSHVPSTEEAGGAQESWRLS